MSDFYGGYGQPISGIYTPVLLGATDNPASVNYAANGQVGYYTYNGNMCRFTASIITTSFSKTSLTDAVRVSLPFSMITLPGLRQLLQAQTVGSGIVKPATSGYADSGNGFMTFQQNSLTGLPVDLTYALTSLGLFSSQMRFDFSGVYPIN